MSTFGGATECIADSGAEHRAPSRVNAPLARYQLSLGRWSRANRQQLAIRERYANQIRKFTLFCAKGIGVWFGVRLAPVAVPSLHGLIVT